MLMNHNQADSCLFPRAKHSPAYVSEPSITHAYEPELVSPLLTAHVLALTYATSLEDQHMLER